MASAAGGTGQRLKPGLAMIRARSSRPAFVSRNCAAVALVMIPSPGAARQVRPGHFTEYYLNFPEDHIFLDERRMRLLSKATKPFAPRARRRLGRRFC